MNERIVIASLGIVSAVGEDVDATLKSLQSGRSGISAGPKHLSAKLTLPVGEIDCSHERLISIIRERLPSEAQKMLSFLERPGMPRSVLLSILAGLEAWRPVRNYSHKLRAGIVSANTVGGMDITEEHFEAYKDHPGSFDFSVFRHHECCRVTEWTQRFLGIRGWSGTISTACSSSANSLITAARLLAQDHLDMVLAGGVDALTAFTMNGFNALKILDQDPCQPFDEHRRGLNLGEGAAYIVLCRESTAKALGFPFIAVLSGYANSNDAFHQTASSPEGTGNILAMTNALKKAGLGMADIDYINLHGTGTDNNDFSEGRAIQAICEAQGDPVPAASSTKAFTGHTLGAAGAVEAVFSCLAIREHAIWPHLRLKTPMAAFDWRPQTIFKRQNVRHVLSNSFGFGGNCSTLIFSKG
ncbi:MAG TPA: beta-ketoacyl-[acyl-carrier-protein] synthase family protein [Edaphocola sp.]|nr:beta-ketoacyl-[acyl-carrier-protein] synthase family protein [Edaphocola sp.]